MARGLGAGSLRQPASSGPSQLPHHPSGGPGPVPPVWPCSCWGLQSDLHSAASNLTLPPPLSSPVPSGDMLHRYQDPLLPLVALALPPQSWTWFPPHYRARAQTCQASSLCLGSATGHPQSPFDIPVGPCWVSLGKSTSVPSLLTPQCGR